MKICNQYFIAISALSLAFAAQAEMVNENRFPFKISYSDGTVENAVLKYQAYVTADCQQSGEASKPLQGHPFDDRKADWRVESWIQRDVCILSKSLGEQCRGQWSKVFNDSRSGASKSFNIIKLNLGHMTCGDAEIKNAMRDGTQSITTKIINVLPQIVNQDKETTLNMLKGADIKSIDIQ